MRRAVVPLAVLAGLLAVVAASLSVVMPAHAAEWDTIRPGVTTQAAVRNHLGAPSKTGSQKVEGYDSLQWIYEGEQAPAGMVRVTIDFGLLTPEGYRPEIVRQMVLEPRRGVFTRNTVLAGWGVPDGSEADAEKRVFRYRAGLFVYFDKEGWIAERMYFTPPQPAAPPPRR